MDISNGFEILQEEVLREIPKLERQQVRPSFIFLDPPYSSQNLYREALERLANSVSSEDALVIVEHDKKFDPGAVFGALRRIRKLEQGDAGLSFYRHER
jgi:16S rRNA G966 N2-methylase RsmD